MHSAVDIVTGEETICALLAFFISNVLVLFLSENSLAKHCIVTCQLVRLIIWMEGPESVLQLLNDFLGACVEIDLVLVRVKDISLEKRSLLLT